MRMKLARNYNYSTHSDASSLRDLGTIPLPEPQAPDSSLLELVRVAGRTQSISEEEDLLLEQPNANSPGAREREEVGSLLQL